MSTVNPFARYTDDEVVARHSNDGSNSHWVSEMLRRLMVSMATQHESTTRLSQSIENLNRWLLRVTVAIGFLTAIQAAAAIVQGLAAWRVLRP